MDSRSEFLERSQRLEPKIEEWRKTWKHKKPCKEWKMNKRIFGRGWCKHLRDAEYRKFKTEINALFEGIL